MTNLKDDRVAPGGNEPEASSLYIDSRGVEVSTSFSEALETIHEMALSNLSDENDIIYGDRGMATMTEWQKEALYYLEELVMNHHEKIDETFLMPERAEDTDPQLLEAGRELSPQTPSHAIRICLEMAKQVAIDPAQVVGIDKADACDQQQVAIDLTEDFIRLYANDLDASITNVAVPGL